MGRYLAFSYVLISLLGLGSATNAASPDLIPVSTLPTSFDTKSANNTLSIIFDLPNEISPSQGVDATWGVVPQIERSNGDLVIIKGLDNPGFSEIWGQSIKQVGNRATFNIKFTYAAKYKLTFWARVGNNNYTYIHNINVLGVRELEQAPELKLDISYVSSKVQAIVTVTREGINNRGCLGLLKSATYLSIVNSKKSLSEFYTQGNPAYKYCNIDFDANGIATFAIDITDYQNNGNEIYLGYFFYSDYQNALISYPQGPQIFRAYRLQLAFPSPKISHVIYCEPLFREKMSKCSLFVSAQNAVGANVYLEKEVTTTISIKKSVGNETKLISGKYGAESVFYIGPDSSEQSLTVKIDGESPYTYVVKPHNYSAEEIVETNWTLSCVQTKLIAKCKVSNTSLAKYGFELPSSIPLVVSQKSWTNGEEAQEAIVFQRSIAPNSSYDFQVSTNAQLEAIQIGVEQSGIFASWENPVFIRPISATNSVLSLTCPKSFKGTTVKCELEYGTLSNSKASLQISIEGRNTSSGWKVLKKISIGPNKPTQITIPSIIDTRLQIRATALISGEKLYSEVSEWQTSSASSQSKPSLEGAIKNAMAKQCQKLPAGFSKYSVQYSKQTISSDGVPGFIYTINKKTYIQIYNMGGWYMGPSNAISDRKTWSAWGCGGGIWIY